MQNPTDMQNPTEMTYFFAEEWRGSLKVSTMRTFTTFEKVVEHCVKLHRATIRPKTGSAIEVGFFRAYRLKSDVDEKPKLMNKEIKIAVAEQEGESDGYRR